MNTATVFDIEKFATHDGPGIRTVVFMKGCPLRCKWCHNPESWESFKQILFDSEKCTSCGRCQSVCSSEAHTINGLKHNFDRTKCKRCATCSETCLNGALQLCGQDLTVKEVLDEVLKDKIFYDNSHGGVTLSGGEPFAQKEFALEFLKKAKDAGLHTAVETCGFVPQTTLNPALPFVDLFLFDIKTTDAEKHRELAGQDNELILSNLDFLNSKVKKGGIILRCPLIPGINDTKEELRGIGRLANKLSQVEKIEIEPYHPLGVKKGEKLGIKVYEADFPKADYADNAIKQIAELTDKTVIKS